MTKRGTAADAVAVAVFYAKFSKFKCDQNGMGHKRSAERAPKASAFSLLSAVLAAAAAAVNWKQCWVLAKLC